MNAKVEGQKKALKGTLGSGSRFASLESKLSHEKGVDDPAAVAAAIGRNKFGAKGFAALSHKD